LYNLAIDKFPIYVLFPQLIGDCFVAFAMPNCEQPSDEAIWWRSGGLRSPDAIAISRRAFAADPLQEQRPSNHQINH